MRFLLLCADLEASGYPEVRKLWVRSQGKKACVVSHPLVSDEPTVCVAVCVCARACVCQYDDACVFVHVHVCVSMTMCVCLCTCMCVSV